MIKVRLTDQSGVVQLAADGIQVIGPSGGGGGGGTVDATTVLQTGDLKPRYGTGVLTGFVRCNGKTIGSATSGGTERANADCQALFQYLWGADANLTISGGRGASGVADWTANKQINLPDWRGRGLAFLDDMGSTAAGRLTQAIWGNTTASPIVLGTAGGAESHTLTLSELPAGITAAGSSGVTVSSTVANVVTGTVTTASNGTGVVIRVLDATGGQGSLTSTGSVTINSTSNNTGGVAHAIASPSMLATIYIKL